MQDLPSERAVLSSIINYGSDSYIEISDIVSTESFTDDEHQVIWKCFEYVFNKDINTKLDYPTLLSASRELGLGDYVNSKNGRDYLKSLKNFHSDFSNTRKFAGKIVKCKIIRDLKSRIQEASYKVEQLTGAESIDAIVSAAENPIIDFTSSLTDHNDKSTSLRDNTAAYINHLLDNPRDLCGISTGFPTLDKLMGGGMRRGSVTMFAARPGIGKTTLSNNIGLHVGGNLNIPVLILDSEMCPEGLQPRFIANLSNIPIDDIETGSVADNPYKRESINKAIEKFESCAIHYKSVNGFQFEDIVSYARRWILKNVGLTEEGRRKDCLIIVDYLKLMNEGAISRDLKEYQALGFCMQHLSDLAIKCDVPVLSFVQENRDDFVSQSDRIVWLASNVFLFKEKTPEEIAEDSPAHGNRKLISLKTRFGPGIQYSDYICFNLKGKTNQLRELGLRSFLKNNPKEDDNQNEFETESEGEEF